ncbi:aspartate kinase [Holzapfeliella floricola]|uniref:Aspartokinase n=1 Tax=Holzapfeliella floricola DSM 23037 = JCM 16512 TaxID=1423744 RepID=A0A0R2DIT5_9LACO|nr:aspartate kinase [Holzapfeliella floricola]KRN03985.1 aspartate kinase [Holzapfeliella floricola DSM 23037 = JCM 16512]
MIIAKFGGSSLAGAHQFNKVKSLVQNNPNRTHIVVSAMGKDEANPVKLTDELIALYDNRANDELAAEHFERIKVRLLTLKKDLALTVNLDYQLEDFYRNLNHLSYAECVSRGEYFTAQLMAEYLGYQFVDAIDFLVLNQNQVDLKSSQEKFAALNLQDTPCVFPGFYGLDNQGNMQLMPRSGSDTSGSVIANLLDADLYENWTDVAGIKAADPRLIDNPKRIEQLTYDELQELAYMGLSVFQEDAIKPIKDKNIPTRILDTNHPDALGTTICNEFSNQLITGLVGQQNYTIIHIKKFSLSRDYSNFVEIFKLMSDLSLAVSYTFSGKDHIDLIVESSQLNKNKALLFDKLQTLFPTDCQITLKEDISLIAAVSDKFSAKPYLVSDLIEQLNQNEIDVQFVNQSSTDVKVLFGVKNDDYIKALQLLYNYVEKKEKINLI